jgi:hypothetical protein
VSTDDDLHARDRESYARGGAKVDPTANVLNLVREAITRQDDLRNLESAHTTEIANLRAHYDEKLREAETARIDAIRAVDVGAVNRAAEVAATQANTLAGQVATSAETLRNQVAAAATAAATALAAALSPIQAAVEDLRRAQYETQGQKSQIVETRDVRAEGRLNANLLVGCAALLLTSIIIAIAIYSAAHGG